MKRFSLTVLCIAATLAGGPAIWKLVLPFLSTVIGPCCPTELRGEPPHTT